MLSEEQKQELEKMAEAIEKNDKDITSLVGSLSYHRDKILEMISAIIKKKGGMTRETIYLTESVVHIEDFLNATGSIDAAIRSIKETYKD
jgi:hypothetical protein